MKTRHLIAATVIGLMSPMGPVSPIGPIAAAAAESVDLRQSAARQEQIRAESQQLVTRLDEVLAEYARNGLAKGDDFEVLKNVRAELGSLSDEDMEKVVALLTQAGAGGDAQSATGQVVKAYSSQKDISLRLKQILAAHERQQDIDALAGEVSKLADRQSANLSTAIDSKQLAAQDKTVSGQMAVAASEQAQQGEQAAIAGEAKLISEKLARIAVDAGEPKYKDEAAQLAQVQPQASAAADALGGGKIEDAVAAEKAARQQLAQVARALAPVRKAEDAQNGEAGQLAAIARDQHTLLSTTARLKSALEQDAVNQTQDAMDKAMLSLIRSPSSPLAKKMAAEGITPNSPLDQIRKTPEMSFFLTQLAAGIKQQEAALSAQLAALAADEAALAAKAQMVREDLEHTAKEAAAPMANALTQMNSAQDALAQGDNDEAVQDETDAANQLDQASKLVDQSGANAPQPGQAGDRQQQLRQLQGAVHDLAARENTAIQQGDARKTGPMAAAAADLQQDMSGKAEGLQQTATAQASASAQALQDAADAMQNAAQAMRNGAGAGAAEAQQQAAAQKLAAAEQQLGQEAGAAAQEQQQLAQMRRQMDDLARLIQEQQQVSLMTGKALEHVAWEAARAKVLARDQAATRRDTENVRQAVNTASPEVAKALDQADASMGDAAQKLTNADAQEAQPPQQAALAALYKAQDGLADKMQKMAQELGQPQPGGQSLASAEAEIGKAQQEAAAAQQAAESGQAGMHQAAARSGQAAYRMAQLARQPQGLPQAARDAIRQAEQALGAAAQAAEGGHPEQAQAQAAQGQQALAAAQSALGQAQAGIAGLTPVPGQGGQPGQDAPGQGNQPGQGDQPAPAGKGTGAKERTWTDQAGTVAAAMQGEHGAGQFLALPERDRAAVRQSQSEKYPQEYGSMIEAYMRSLASDSGGR